VIWSMSRSRIVGFLRDEPRRLSHSGFATGLTVRIPLPPPNIRSSPSVVDRIVRKVLGLPLRSALTRLPAFATIRPLGMGIKMG
jgi:hypothetical protein